MPAPWKKHWPAGPADELGWHAACPPAPYPQIAPLLPDFQRQLHAMWCSTCCCHLQTSSRRCCEKLLVLKITECERRNVKIASLKAALERPKQQLQHRSHKLWLKAVRTLHCPLQADTCCSSCCLEKQQKLKTCTAQTLHHWHDLSVHSPSMYLLAVAFLRPLF